MNCFDEEFLQKYVDGECSADEHSKIEKHIEKCSQCRTSAKSIRKRSEKIKKHLDALVGEIPERPEILTHVKNVKPVFSLKKKLVYGMAAASILLFIALVVNKLYTQQPEETILYYNIDYEIDANKPITEQEMIFYITDENGFEPENDSN